MLKNILIATSAIVALTASSVVLADQAPKNDSGFYAKAQAGLGMTKANGSATYTAGDLTSKSASNANNFAGRIAAGYQVNKYLGFEGGFALYPRYVQNLALAHGLAGVDSVTQSLKTNLFAFDLLTTGHYDFSNKVFVEGGLGLAYVNAHTRSGGTVTTIPGEGTVFGPASSETNGFIRPKAMAGVGYNLNSKMAVDVVYSRIFGRGSFANDTQSKYLPNLDMVAVGLTYKF
jgi:opacity protein-like surface antigen